MLVLVRANTAVFGIIVNHFRTQQLSDVRLDIFKFVEESQRAPLWHTLKYLLLLPHLYSEPLCQSSSQGNYWEIDLRCWIYEVDVRAASRLGVSLQLKDIAVDPVTIHLGTGSTTLHIDLIHGQISTASGPLSRHDQYTGIPRGLNVVRGENGAWRMSIYIDRPFVKGCDIPAAAVSVRGLHD